MSITLQNIWEISSKELQGILQRSGYNLTDNINYDRALIAQIYYNAGELKDKAESVSHPQFLEMMSASSSLEEGIQSLQEPFQRSLLHLYGSLVAAGRAAATSDPDAGDAAVFAAGWAARHASGAAAVDVAGTAIVDAAWGAAWGITIDAARGAALEATMVAARLPRATPQTIGKAAAEAAWKVVIEKDSIIKSKISEIKLGKGEFQPSKIYEQLLKVDLSLLIPKARCFYLYSLWELLQLVPSAEARYEEKLQTLLDRYGCLRLFESEYPLDVADPHLVKALGPLLLQYIGAPPRPVIMERLLNM